MVKNEVGTFLTFLCLKNHCGKWQIKIIKKKKLFQLYLSFVGVLLLFLLWGFLGIFLCWFFSWFFSPLVAKHVSSCPVVKPFIFFSILPRV